MPDKSSSKKVAAKSFILQGDAEPLSSAPVWAEPSQLLIGMSVKNVTGALHTEASRTDPGFTGGKTEIPAKASLALVAPLAASECYDPGGRSGSVLLP